MRPSAKDVTPELRQVLACILADEQSGRLADAEQVGAFLHHVSDAGIEIVALTSSQVLHAQAVVLCVPGGSGVLMLSPALPGAAWNEPTDAIRAAVARLAAERHLYMLQALLPSAVDARAAWLQRAGFARLTRLVYMGRTAGPAPAAPISAPPHTWVAFDERSRAAFCATILRTYEQSADCPELTGIRPIEAVLLAHQAAGPFDASLWELLVLDGVPAACLLLSRVSGASLVEIVYVGCVPEQRGRGLGRVLLGRAVALARGIGATGMTIVADERNVAALTLYERFGFRRVTVREAYWRDSRSRTGE